MSLDILEHLQLQSRELIAIEASHSNWSKIKEWHVETRPFISLYFPTHLEEYDRLGRPPFKYTMAELKQRASGARNQGLESPRNDQSAREAKDQLLALLKGLLKIAPPSSVVTRGQVNEVGKTNDIFVVHGHDNELSKNLN